MAECSQNQATQTGRSESGGQQQVKRRAACDECSKQRIADVNLKTPFQTILRSSIRNEEAQMLRWTTGMLTMCPRKHYLRLLAAEADGTAEKAAEDE